MDRMERSDRGSFGWLAELEPRKVKQAKLSFLLDAALDSFHCCCCCSRLDL